MAKLPFHHKRISRLQAENLLKAEDKDGTYLVRDSETVFGAYTLCVWYHGVVHQYRILPDKEKRLYIQANEGVPEKKFANIGLLIQHYIQRGENNGLVCALKQPVGKKEEDKESDDDDYNNDYRDPETSGTCFTLPSKDDILTSHFHQRFSQLDSSSVDGGFIEDVKQYISNGLQKDATAIQGGTGVTGLREIHQLLAKAAQPLEKQLQEFLGKVELCQHLFAQGKTKKTKEQNIDSYGILVPDNEVEGSSSSTHTYQNDLGQIIDRLACCSTEVSSLDKKAVKCLQEMSAISVTSSTADENEIRSIVINPPRRRPIPPAAFKVKAVKGMLLKEVSITLDLNGGKLIIVTPNKSLLDQECMPTQDKIEQLIKSKDNNLRLDVKIEGRKRETYQFEDARSRENFCQLIHQMKNIHAPADQIDAITVFIGTWNMGDEQPGYNINSWLKCSGTGRPLDKSLSAVPHDVYVIGTQESSLTEKEWTSKIRKTLQAIYEIDLHMIATTSLWGIRLIILTKMEHKNRISHVQTSFVRTGIANTLGNKGAVGVSFSFLATSLCFVCAHLTSGAEKNHRRNSNFRDITKGLSLGNKQLNLFDMTKQFHHLFWLGDLNYRLDEKVDVILKKIQEKDYEHLLSNNDQLTKSKNASEAFQYFCEEPINFPPTYRYEKGTKSEYAWKKYKKTGLRINVPSWCDRVLWKSYPGTYVNSRAYGCNEEFMTSDHKPVFASFEIGIASQFISKEPSLQDEDVEIIFESCEAELNTTSRQNYVLEFHSTCLEAPVSSKSNVQYRQREPNCYIPKWTKDMCPPLKPIVPDINYLEDQYILIAVKSVDVHESYGECVIAAKPYFSVFPVPFECVLTHHAEETGLLRGRLHVKVPMSPLGSMWSQRSRKSYEVTMHEEDSRRFSADCAPSTKRDLLQAPAPRGMSYNGCDTSAANKNLYPLIPITKPSSLGLAKAPKSNLTPGPVAEPRNRKPSPSPRSPATTPTERSPETTPVGTLISLSPTWEKPPLMPKDASMTKERIYDDVPEEREVPPAPPKRIQSLEMDTYTKIARPKTIEEWLNQIQLAPYINMFKQNGWDSLAFLCDLSDDDLQGMKVEKTHRKRIMDSIVELNK
ncbi:phosphatidylinositol 3,4,5-trisphosphate 5-phosphatase 2-like isoform X2 [Lineus longissimus]|uniref:phosphatidylinositol 3,4,5-trisphosphate 5-phosphatase 2-like isoform X2 n=1 Tax=Lineus longissimus TaxID=88925 RepID=UPI00315DAE56